MLDLEVGDADRAGATVGAELLQRLPRGDEVAAVKGRERPMDQEQVDVIEAELVERCLERAASVVRSVVGVVELAGDEHLRSVQAGGADGLPDAALVAVHLGGVDVPVARLECSADRLSSFGGIDLKDAKPKLRDRMAVVERDVGNGAPTLGCAHACPLSVRMVARPDGCSSLQGRWDVDHFSSSAGMAYMWLGRRSGSRGPDELGRGSPTWSSISGFPYLAPAAKRR
jgi:hypothetical protein